MRIDALALWVVFAMLGCGDEHPDTGYGANAPVPATKNCAEACARVADCVVHLCNEDTDSTRFTDLADLLAIDCEFDCDDARLAAEYSDESWQCLFQSTCRKVLEDDVCGPATYNCD